MWIFTPGSRNGNGMPIMGAQTRHGAVCSTVHCIGLVITPSPWVLLSCISDTPPQYNDVVHIMGYLCVAVNWCQRLILFLLFWNFLFVLEKSFGFKLLFRTGNRYLAERGCVYVNIVLILYRTGAGAHYIAHRRLQKLLGRHVVYRYMYEKLPPKEVTFLKV